MLHLLKAKKKPCLESSLTLNSVLTNMLVFLCSIAGTKLHYLGCIASFMPFVNEETLMKAFIVLHFNYYFMPSKDISLKKNEGII